MTNPSHTRPRAENENEHAKGAFAPYLDGGCYKKFHGPTNRIRWSFPFFKRIRIQRAFGSHHVPLAIVAENLLAKKVAGIVAAFAMFACSCVVEVETHPPSDAGVRDARGECPDTVRSCEPTDLTEDGWEP